MATKQKTTVKAKTETKSKGTVALKTDQIRQKILEYRDVAEQSWLNLAELLYEAYHGDFYKEWGFDDFSAYVDTELQINYRKTMYLVDIWDTVKKNNIPREKALALGWTKMKDVAQIIDKKNAKKLLEKAEKMSSRDLTEAVKKIRRKDTTNADLPTIITMSLKMSEAESHTITGAIAEAKKMTQNNNDVVALELICQDWLENQDAVPEKVSLEDRIEFIAKHYNTVLIVNKTATAKLQKLAAQEDIESVVDDAEAEAEAEVKAEDKAAKKADAKKTPATGKAKGKTKAKPDPEPDDDDLGGDLDLDDDTGADAELDELDSGGSEEETDIDDLLGIDA